jgi:hypothetical protein
MRQAREAPRATTETRVAWVAYERGITDRQLEQFYYVNRKGAKQRHFNTEAFAKKYGVDTQWLWHGELIGHPRGLRKQPSKTNRRPAPAGSSRKARVSKNGTPEERAAKAAAAAAAAAMPAPANVVTLSRDQPTPPIVDAAERIVARYNQLDLEGQELVSKLIRDFIAQSRK